MDLNEILKIALTGQASDIHLKAGIPPMFRIDGKLAPLKNATRLSPDYIQELAMGMMNSFQKEFTN